MINFSMLSRVTPAPVLARGRRPKIECIADRTNEIASGTERERHIL
jgi:hypothetical protein